MRIIVPVERTSALLVALIFKCAHVWFEVGPHSDEGEQASASDGAASQPPSDGKLNDTRKGESVSCAESDAPAHPTDEQVLHCCFSNHASFGTKSILALAHKLDQLGCHFL